MDPRAPARSVSISNSQVVIPNMDDTKKTLLTKSQSSKLFNREKSINRQSSFAMSTSSKTNDDVFSNKPGPSFASLLSSKRLARRLTSRMLVGRSRSMLFSQASAVTTVQKEPTYRMEPKDQFKFNTSKVETIAKAVLEEKLNGMAYNPRICSNMSRYISDEIKERVKLLNFDRYKIIVMVFIGEDKDQGVQISSRCAWNETLDTFATSNFKSDTLYATVTVYGIYNE